jgi:hypothetical protein
VVIGSCCTVTVRDLLQQPPCDQLEFRSWVVKPGDVVCAATALDLDLSTDESSYLERAIRGSHNGFRQCKILLNSILHTPGQEPVQIQIERPQTTLPAPASEELVLWVRLQLYMKYYLETNSSYIPIQFFDALKQNVFANRHPHFLKLAYILQSPTVCWHLTQFIKPGYVFKFKILDVVSFFECVIHSLNFLQEQKLVKDRDAFLVEVIDKIKAWKFTLSNLNASLFNKFASHFDYIQVTYGPKSSCLRRVKNNIWAADDMSIRWQNNWTIRISNEVVATKVVSRNKCLPFLSCLQPGGQWTSSLGSLPEPFSVVIGESTSFIASTSLSNHSSFPTPFQTSTTSVTPALARPVGSSPYLNLVVDQKTNRKSELRDHCTVIKRQRIEAEQYNTNQFSSVFSYLSPFFGWDSILNVLSSPESFSVSTLQDLLEKCLWIWAQRNGNHEELNTFWVSATNSLRTYDGKGTALSGGGEDWKSFFTDYGCYETPRLWTFNERLMLMVACSWPAYYWKKIHRKRSNESSASEIRGMALLHPRFTQFVHSRMLEFGLIHNVNVPPEFSDFSALNICFNNGEHGFTQWKWRNFFVLDSSVSPTFLRLTGCQGLNADGVYAATSVTVNGTRVYAFFDTKMLSKCNVSQESCPDVKDCELDHPTVISVSFSADSKPQLEWVKFAFALHLQEYIIMRCDHDYKQFFSVAPDVEEFIYTPVSASLVVTESLISVGTLTQDVYFSFGPCVEVLPEQLDSVQPLTTEVPICDSSSNFHSCLKSQEVSICKKLAHSDAVTTISIHGLGVSPKQPIDISANRTPDDVGSIPRGALFSVFPDTYVGVQIGNRTVVIKIQDGCAFLYWFSGFEPAVGPSKCHFCLHLYFFSENFRHFPVDTPEQFFVFFAAAKLAQKCMDPLSLGAFQTMILQTLNTFQCSGANPLPKMISKLSDLAVNDAIENLYSLVSTGGSQSGLSASASSTAAVTVPHCSLALMGGSQSVVSVSASSKSDSAAIVDAAAAYGGSGDVLNAVPAANVASGFVENGARVDVHLPFFGLLNGVQVQSGRGGARKLYTAMCPYNSLIQVLFRISLLRSEVINAESDKKSRFAVCLKSLFERMQNNPDPFLIKVSSICSF